MRSSELLQAIYGRLLASFGPQDWWPGDSPFEIMVGAVLTQNTNWKNVELAILRLKEFDVLSLEAMSSLPQSLLAEYIKPAGYYNIKAARLHNMFRLLQNHWGGDVEYFLQQPMEYLREQLLSVNGIGAETADSIILYAAKQPIFVVDAYTHRILSRHNIIDESFNYYEIQELFQDNLERNVELFNEYHALIVQVGKKFCKKTTPDCMHCPLAGINGVTAFVPEF